MYTIGVALPQQLPRWMKQVLVLPGAMSRQRCCPSNGRRTTIDRQLLSMKATYFFLFAG